MALITDHREDTIEERTTYAPINGTVIEGHPTRLLPQDTRVRWGGVMSGFFVALGVLLLMGALGLAIGVTALGGPAHGDERDRLGPGDRRRGVGLYHPGGGRISGNSSRPR